MAQANPVIIEIAEVLDQSEADLITTPTNGIIRSDEFEKYRWPYILSVPAMWMIVLYVRFKKSARKKIGLGEPCINTLLFDGLGRECKKVKEYATTWRAMDIIYNHPFPYRKTPRGLVDEFYWNSLNCQALRNRLKLNKSELRSAIAQLDEAVGEIRLLSLACGSAESSIEVIAECKNKGKNVKGLLVDIDKDALNRAKELINHYGIEDRVETLNESAYSLKEISREFKPHIIDLFGLFDYITENEAISLAKKIHESLEFGGFFLTCNISPNIEQHFLTWVINWPMIYRKPSDIIQIAKCAGFEDFRIIYEPLKVHGILIARKGMLSYLK